nr:unnamed protein product [Leishmania braziliensis]
MSNANVSTFNPQIRAREHGFPSMREASAVTVFKSCESLADQMRDNLRSPRSGVRYNYLTTSDGTQRLHAVDSSHGRQACKKPSNLRSCDYLDEDQNRALNTQRTSNNNCPCARHGDASCFDSDSDEEERLINHQIRMLEAQQAAANMCKSANPGPVGLLGFGLSTILLNLHNTGRFPLSTVIVAMGIALGGGAQVIAGLLEWVRGNTFAHVAFTSYGAFWLSLVLVWLLPNTAARNSSIVEPASEYFVGVYLVLWGIFSFFMLMCTIRMNVAIFIVILTVTLLFLILGFASMTGSQTALRVAGYEGVICGSTALYLAFAEILNEVWDRIILPVIPMTQLLDWLGSKEDRSVTTSTKEK